MKEPREKILKKGDTVKIKKVSPDVLITKIIERKGKHDYYEGETRGTYDNDNNKSKVYFTKNDIAEDG